MKTFTVSLLGGLFVVAVLFLVGWNSQNGTTILGPVDGNEFFIYPAQWDDMLVSLDRARGTGAGTDADFETFAGGTLKMFAFDDGTDEELFFSLQMSHAYKFGTDLHCHIHWAPSSAGAGTVRWCYDYSFQEIGGTFTAGTTNNCVTATASGVAWQHQIDEFSPDVSGAALDSVSAIMVGRLFRDADASTGGTDTYAADAFGLSFDCHYQRDTNGSRSEYIK